VLWLDYSIAQVIWLLWPVKYFPVALVINFRRSLGAAFGCVASGLKYRQAKMRGGNSMFLPDE
jgi:hypothetical protein